MVTRAEEARDLARTRDCQALERRPARPVDERIVVGLVLPRRLRDHPLGEVDLLEPLSPRDRETPGAPQVLERGLAQVPVPPAAGRSRALRREVAGHDRPLRAHEVEHAPELVLVGIAVPAAKAPLDHVALALEAQFPVWIEAHGEDRRDIMGPVLEQSPVDLERPAQQLRPVASVAREQDHVVRALDRADAVDLEKAEALDQIGHALGREPARAIGETLAPQDQAARLLGGDLQDHPPHIAHIPAGSPPGAASATAGAAPSPTTGGPRAPPGAGNILRPDLFDCPRPPAENSSMSRASTIVLPLATALALPSGAALAQDKVSPDDARLAFNNRCRQCHVTKEGDNRLGPSLYGVVGRKAGSAPKFAYSSAMKNADFVWDPEKLEPLYREPPTPWSLVTR